MTDITSKNNQLSPVKRALLEIRELRGKLAASERARSEPIAIIGMGCRIPGGVTDPESFWRLMNDGVDGIGEIPSERWDANALYDPDPDAPGKMSTRWGGFMDNIDKFDPDFFGISPREAVSMDPQQRLLLEVAYESLENGCQSPENLFGSKTGVFIGIGGFDYWQLQIQKGERKKIDAYFATGVTHSVAAGRLSYVFGFQGPSIAVDTACSSSLVVVHQAVQSLRSGECNLALAGGVNLILTPELHINFSKTHVMAADGRCKAFDARADGFVRSEGCGIVVLKRLADALRDGDTIGAVIRGSAVNQDGRSSGLTAPNGPSQQEVIRNALANARVNPAQVQFIEAHGTGTSLGDPIEVQALAAVFGKDREKSDSLSIGSVKTNIGHLEMAAGIVGMMKVVLALQHQRIPPHLHLQKLNPHIPWADIPITVPRDGVSWSKGEKTRFAGVSSFGFSGTNVHIVLEEAPPQEEASSGLERPLHLMGISAQTPKALDEKVLQLTNYLTANPNIRLADIAYSTNVGRSHFIMRLPVIAETTIQVVEDLTAYLEKKEPAKLICGKTHGKVHQKVVFLFTGQGAQRIGMGLELFEGNPVFRSAMSQCDELLQPYLPESLLTVLHAKEGAEQYLDQTAYTQPALFALEYSLAKLWMSWGITPGAVIGHSVGEYVAACVAGVFSLEDGIRLIAERGRLMQALPPKGMMAAVFAPESVVRKALELHKASVVISAVNSPNDMVISGESAAMREILSNIEKDNINFHVLKVSHAFHSPLMEPMLASFEKVAKDLTYTAPRIDMVSNVTGKILGPDVIPGADYWRDHVLQPVLFASGIQSLYEQNYRHFVELGPRPVLSALGRQCVPEQDTCWFPSCRKDLNDWQSILESLGGLYARGIEIDWTGFDKSYSRHKIVLPTYPFQRERYWLDLSEDSPKEQRDTDPSLIWQEAVRSGRRQSLQVPVDLELHTYSTKWRCLDRLTTAYIVDTFRKLGVYNEPQKSYSVNELLTHLNILPVYHGLLCRWLERLTKENLLEHQGEIFTCRQPLPDSQLTSRQEESRQALEDIPFLQRFMEHCGGLLIPVLTGEQTALETIFGGSSETGENLYQHWAIARYFNQITAAIAESYAKHALRSRQLRILEIGAGTGGTTSSVLSLLPGDRTLYYYTDVSEVFFNKAEIKFKAYPFVRYGILDIEQDPKEQGFGVHGFDIVIASNVLHTTTDLHKTMENVLSLLAPSGLLLLFEVTKPHSWLDITFALFEGWNRLNDDLRHDNSPLLSRSGWQTLLDTSGFQNITAFPEPGSPTEILQEHVFLAQAPSSNAHQKVCAPDYSIASFDSYLNADPKENLEDGREPHAPAILAQLRDAPAMARGDLLVDFIRSHVMEVLRRDPSRVVDRHSRLMDLGIDSLMAVELKNRLRTGLDLQDNLPATLIFDYPNIEAIAKFIEVEALAIDAPLTQAKREGEGEYVQRTSRTQNIETLSEEAVEEMLLKKLESLEEGD